MTPNSPSAPEVVELDQDSVTLRWSHENPNLVWTYIVEFRRTDEQRFSRLTQVSRPEITLEGVLSPDTEYGFRVLAENSVGTSEPSRETVVKTLPIGTRSV